MLRGRLSLWRAGGWGPRAATVVGSSSTRWRERGACLDLPQQRFAALVVVDALIDVEWAPVSFGKRAEVGVADPQGPASAARLST